LGAQNGFVWFALALFGAMFFYWLRCTYRGLYGLPEIIVGIIILALRFLATPPSPLLGAEPSPVYGTLTGWVAMFTGIYAIVRGIDNIFESRKLEGR